MVEAGREVKSEAGLEAGFEVEREAEAIAGKEVDREMENGDMGRKMGGNMDGDMKDRGAKIRGATLSESFG